MDDLFNEGDDLNDIQKEFIEQLEAQFCDRFTEKDDNFMKVFNNNKLIPPIMDPWKRAFDRRNRVRRREHDNDFRDNYGPRRRYNDNRHNRYDDRRYNHYDNHHRDRYHR